MRIRSLGWQTDIALRRLEGSEVIARPDHLIVRTPSNPGFRWGNFLLLSAELAEHGPSRWKELYAGAFPGADFLAVGIDDPRAQAGDAAGDSLSDGTQKELSAVLTAAALREPEAGPAATEYRPLAGDRDWAAELRLREAVEGALDPDARDFLKRRRAAVRRVCERGHGAWFGAFCDGEMHAGLGIFDAGHGVARFQAVDTHPEHRRRGLARNLLHAAGRHALSQLGAGRLVIVADPHYFAIDLYRSLGFRERERQLQFERVPS